MNPIAAQQALKVASSMWGSSISTASKKPLKLIPH